MAMVSRSGQMVHVMKEIGNIIGRSGSASSLILMETFMKEIG